MTTQGGVFYGDQRPISRGETTAILKSLTSRDHPRVLSWQSDGVFMACASADEGHEEPAWISRSISITFDGRLDNRDDLLLQSCDLLHGATSDAALAAV